MFLNYIFFLISNFIYIYFFLFFYNSNSAQKNNIIKINEKKLPIKIIHFKSYKKNIIYNSNKIILGDNIIYINKNGYIKKTFRNKILWCNFYKINKNLINSDLIYSLGKIFVILSNGQINCLDSINGNIIWTIYLNNLILSTPIITDNIIFIKACDNELYALNKYNGKILWHNKFYNNNIYLLTQISPLIINNIIIINNDKEILFIEKLSGEEKWKYYMNNIKNNNLLEIHHDYKNLYLCYKNGFLYKYNLKKKYIIWKRKYNTFNKILITCKSIILIDINSKIKTINKKNGNILWENNQFINMSLNNIICIDNIIFILSTNGFVIILNKESGEIKSKFFLKKSFKLEKFYKSPIIYRKKIYIISE